jgi:hypothetical protein
MLEYTYHGNRHTWDVPLEDVPSISKCGYAAMLFYLVSMVATKTSLLIFYRRVFQSPVMVRIVDVVLVFNCMFFIAMLLTSIFQCDPVSSYWGYGGKCINNTDFTLVWGIVNTVIDFAILLLPIHIIKTLKVSLVQRLQLVTLFSGGFLVVAASVIRTIYSAPWAVDTYDSLWFSYNIFLCAIVEVYLGIICASLPPCKRLFQTWAQKSTKSLKSTMRNTTARFSSTGGTTLTEFKVQRKTVINTESYRSDRHRPSSSVVSLDDPSSASALPKCDLEMEFV